MKKRSSKKSPSSKAKTQPSKSGTTSFLLEIGSEELPWQMIQPAMTQLAKSLAEMLTEQHVNHGAIRSFGTPRRLAVLAEGVAKKQTSSHQEVLGPSKAVAFDAQGKPTKAAEGFAKSQGIHATALQIRETPKGEYVCAVKHREGRPTDMVLKESVPQLIQGLSFPKTMRWNASGMRYPRPIRWVVALLGSRTISVEVGGVKSGNRTWGHRFMTGKTTRLMATKGLEVKRPEVYETTLERAGVVADPLRRRTAIKNLTQSLAKTVKGQPYPANHDELLDQAVFSLECPNMVCGEFDKKYLGLPPEVLITSMKEHQGFFSVVTSKQTLLPRFLAPTNMKIPKMEVITAGNERVLAARLSDAQYFFEQDCKGKLADRVSHLNGVVFHKKLGTLYQKTERTISLIGALADASGLAGHKESCQRAALLNKADLITGMVGEFPTLQGVMGREYATHDGEPAEVCQALGESYQPRTPEDAIPVTAVGRLLSLADRIDTLAAFFQVGMIPSGSEDPFALRRQAFGLVRILVEANINVNLIDLLRLAEQLLEKQGVKSESPSPEEGENPRPGPLQILVEFLEDRLRFYGRTLHSFREDVMAAVLKGRPVDRFSMADLFSRMHALQAITTQKDFDPLMVGFKRAHRLVEKEQWTAIDVNAALLVHQSEQALFQFVEMAQDTVDASIKAIDYSKALQALIELKSPIDAFFDGVLVNAPEPDIRANRLSLLRKIDKLFLGIGDLSQIQVQSS
ncbi:glycine--tRNA ligase subunit beta [Candidatus Nitronereus thalassa]|uniref:Glycine--tRNA ligase beta subunit n=1 Tax=Candidatus Nitronereus thalassa TaxID=3020898 RepID=A0ABU3KC92_9BACT|nr:glycine--tRNA ligase subunit beta [Candidatus Nitronereus thalassa]MDT7043797.1 glycine--tRNA ligase subunit beta [Candidatus Nitronereus thalassa]